MKNEIELPNRTIDLDLSLYNRVKKIADREGLSIKSKFNEYMKEDIQKHEKSYNPQTIIPMFEHETVRAIPNIYVENPDTWIKFYQTLNQKDYDALTEAVERLNRVHQSAKLLIKE